MKSGKLRALCTKCDETTDHTITWDETQNMAHHVKNTRTCNKCSNQEEFHTDKVTWRSFEHRKIKMN